MNLKGLFQDFNPRMLTGLQIPSSLLMRASSSMPSSSAVQYSVNTLTKLSWLKLFIRQHGTFSNKTVNKSGLLRLSQAQGWWERCNKRTIAMRDHCKMSTGRQMPKETVKNQKRQFASSQKGALIEKKIGIWIVCLSIPGLVLWWISKRTVHPNDPTSVENSQKKKAHKRCISLDFQVADIAKSRADVIVNAANSKLQHNGGVAGALSRAAGPSLQEESWEITKSGPVPVGTSVVTKAGSLHAAYVVHTVGPTKEQHRNQPILLKRAFLSALDAARALKAETVAMPLISAGIFGVDRRSVIEALDQALEEHSQKLTSIKSIQIVVNDENIIQEVKSVLCAEE